MNVLAKLIAVAIDPERRRIAWATYKAYREAQRRQAPLKARTKAGGHVFITRSLLHGAYAWDVCTFPHYDSIDWHFARCAGTYYNYSNALDCAHREGIDWGSIQYDDKTSANHGG